MVQGLQGSESGVTKRNIRRSWKARPGAQRRPTDDDERETQMAGLPARARRSIKMGRYQPDRNPKRLKDALSRSRARRGAQQVPNDENDDDDDGLEQSSQSCRQRCRVKCNCIFFGIFSGLGCGFILAFASDSLVTVEVTSTEPLLLQLYPAQPPCPAQPPHPPSPPPCPVQPPSPAQPPHPPSMPLTTPPHSPPPLPPPPSSPPSPSPKQPPSPPPSPPPWTPVPRAPPPKAPGPPAPSPQRIVAVLNERFATGGYSNDLSRVGILLHQFDSYDDGNAYHFQPWDRCASPSQCYAVSDRLSAMTVAQSSVRDPSGAWPIFSQSLAGFIFNPGHNRILCSYPYDAGTAERTCSPLGGTATCVPGCTPNHRAFGCRAGCRGPSWCSLERRGWPCAWPPEHLSESLAVRDRIAARFVRIFGRPQSHRR